MIRTTPAVYIDKEPLGDIDELFAEGASVHLELLSDNAIMLIIEDAEMHKHFTIYHKGRSPIRVREMESWPIEATKQGQMS